MQISKQKKIEMLRSLLLSRKFEEELYGTVQNRT